MAFFNFVDMDGNALPAIDRVNGDEVDAPAITIIVCEPGLCIDVSSPDHLRFVPAPPPPVIERVEVANIGDMGTVVDVELTNQDVLASLEKHLAGLRGAGDEVDEDVEAVRKLRNGGRDRSRFHDW